VKPAHRWALVGVLAITLIGIPLTIANRPAAHQDITAEALLNQILSAQDTPYAGYVETRGTLPLPDSTGFTDVTSLLASEARLRVWWLGPTNWRVAQLKDAGETDLIRRGNRLVRWQYGSQTFTLFREPTVRLPRSSDVVPPALAAHALSGVRASQVSRLPERRVAGRVALGLRITPGNKISTIGRVDIWADAESGVVLRVELYANSQVTPTFVSEFKALEDTAPDPARLSVQPPTGTTVSTDDVLDLADGADQFAPYRFANNMLGLPRSSAEQRGVGLYRAGPTWLLVMPMQDRAAHPLRDQLRLTPGAREDDVGVFAELGPLSVVVTSGGEFRGHVLVAGTVTPQALRQAALALPPPDLDEDEQ
jgi:outer membrane lipoprotein-sorting protein